MNNKNAGIIKDLLIIPNNSLDLLERLRKFVDISHIEGKYLLEHEDLIKKKNIQKYLNRNFL
jgi:hypothetical protein